MAMTRKDFTMLADTLRGIGLGRGERGPLIEDRDNTIIDALCAFLRAQNPLFDETRFREYLFRQENATR